MRRQPGVQQSSDGPVLCDRVRCGALPGTGTCGGSRPARNRPTPRIPPPPPQSRCGQDDGQRTNRTAPVRHRCRDARTMPAATTNSMEVSRWSPTRVVTVLGPIGQPSPRSGRARRCVRVNPVVLESTLPVRQIASSATQRIAGRRHPAGHWRFTVNLRGVPQVIRCRLCGDQTWHDVLAALA